MSGRRSGGHDDHPGTSHVLDGATCRRIRATVVHNIESTGGPFSPPDDRVRSPTESSRRHARNPIAASAARSPSSTILRRRAATPTAAAAAATATPMHRRGAPTAGPTTPCGGGAATRSGQYPGVDRARIARLARLQLEGPKTLSELVVALEHENESLRTDFSDALEHLKSLAATREAYQSAVTASILSAVDDEIAGRRTLYDAERTSRQAYAAAFDVLQSTSTALRIETQRQGMELRGVEAEHAEEIGSLQRQHAIDVARASYRPPMRTALVMTDLSLLHIADAMSAAAASGPSSHPQAAMSTPIQLVDDIMDRVAREAEATAPPASIGCQVAPSDLPSGLAPMGVQCELRPLMGDAQCQAGVERAATATTAVQTEPWRKMEALRADVRHRCDEIERACDIAWAAKQAWVDMIAEHWRGKSTRGTLCVQASDAAVAAAGDPHRLLQLTTSGSSGNEDSRLVSWAWCADGADDVAIDRLLDLASADSVQLPGSYANPSRQLQLLCAALRALQSTVRKLSFDSKRQAAALRKATADATAASAREASLQASVMKLAGKAERQHTMLQKLRTALGLSKTVDDGEASAASRANIVASKPSLEALAETPVRQRAEASGGDFVMKSPPAGSEQPLAIDCAGSPRVDSPDAASDDVGASPRRGGSEPRLSLAVQIAIDVYETAARSMRDHLEDRSSALDRTAAARAASAVAEVTRDFTASVAPDIVAAESKLLSRLDDVARFSGYGSARRRRWGGASPEGHTTVNNQNCSTTSVATASDGAELSPAAASALDELLRSVAALRQWVLRVG